MSVNISLLLTDSDMDGLGSVVLSKAFDIKYNEIKLSVPIKMNSEYMLKFVEDFDDITVTDLSFNENNMKKIIHKGKHISVYDHHLTSSYLNNPYKYRDCISDPSRCGTKIYFEEVVVNKLNKPINYSVRLFVELVDVYDRWQQLSPLWEDACKLNRIYLYYKNYPWIFIERFAEKIKNDKFSFTEDDEEKAKIIADEIEEATKFSDSMIKIYKDTENDKYGVTFYRGFCSEVGNELLKKHDLSYVVLIDSLTHETVSMRSIGNLNCTKFKNIYGHKNAAGGKFTTDYLDDVYGGRRTLELK